jgi:polar amino acid transport system substrate-binding protein
MKKYLILIASALLITSCGNNVDQTDKIQKKGYFIVGLDEHFPPMGFRNEKNKIVGFDIDLAKAVADEMGLKVHFKPVQWDSIILSLNKRNIDAIWNGLTITEGRKEDIDFSPSYLDNHQIIIVRGTSPLRQLEAFNGKIVGIQRGSTSEKAVARTHELSEILKECRKFDNNNQALQALQNKEIDGVVVDEIFGRYYVNKHPGQFIVLDEKLGSELYAVGMRKSDERFQQMLNDALKKVVNGHKGSAISIKWFGKDILKK